VHDRLLWRDKTRESTSLAHHELESEFIIIRVNQSLWKLYNIDKTI